MASQRRAEDRRTANHNARAQDAAPRHISTANSTQLGHQDHRITTRCDRYRDRRQRHRRRRGIATVVDRSLSPAVPLNRFVDREVSDDSLPHSQQGRRSPSRFTRDDDFSGEGGSVQPVSRRHDQRRQVTRNNIDYNTNGINTNGRDNRTYSASAVGHLLSPSASTPLTASRLVNTEQFSSPFPPFNLQLHPPPFVQPATRAEPIRLMNSWGSLEPDTDRSTTGTTARIAPRQQQPVNDRLQRLFTGRRMPRQRRPLDRMILRCSDQQYLR